MDFLARSDDDTVNGLRRKMADLCVKVRALLVDFGRMPLGDGI